MKLRNSKISEFVKYQNSKKKLFTPGPGSLLEENIYGLQPCFGRGDLSYDKIENEVLKKIKLISGHKKITRVQGSASFALEIMIQNFIFGNILIIKTGTYSDRLFQMCVSAKKSIKKINKIEYVEWKNIKKQNKKRYSWILCCYVETSIGFKLPIEDLYKLKMNYKSKLALDATASIGLEENHQLADVIGFSSCKGLLGLTGAGFISYNKDPNNIVQSFNFNIQNHINKKMTGPYHSICSLYYVLNIHNQFRYSIKINKKLFLKKMKKYLIYDYKNQPNLCTLISKKINNKNKKIVLYKSRADISGSVVCHLGEAHLKQKARGKILKYLSQNN